jgi:hypothetical protein
LSFSKNHESYDSAWCGRETVSQAVVLSVWRCCALTLVFPVSFNLALHAVGGRLLLSPTCFACAHAHTCTPHCTRFSRNEHTLDSSGLCVHSLGHTSRRTRWTARISVCWHTVHRPRLGHTLAAFLATTTLLTVSATALSFLTHNRRERSRSDLADEVCVDVLVESVLAPISSASQDQARPHHGKPG